MTEKKFTQQDIAQLAAHLSGMYLEAMQELREEHGATWRDFVYSNFLALKGVALMFNPDEAAVTRELRLIFDEAQLANVVGKRFKDEQEMAAWMAARGLDEDGQPLADAAGPRH